MRHRLLDSHPLCNIKPIKFPLGWERSPMAHPWPKEYWQLLREESYLLLEHDLWWGC